MSKEAGIKSQIMSALESTEDHSMKVVLLLLLQVIEEIGGKIDAVFMDEKSLRAAVLNGHANEHNADHDWIRLKRQEEVEEKTANLTSKRKIRDEMYVRLIWSVVSIGVAFAAGWAIK